MSATTRHPRRPLALRPAAGRPDPDAGQADHRDPHAGGYRAAHHLSVAGLGFLRSYLLGQADGQLTALAAASGPGSVSGIVQSYLAHGRSQPYSSPSAAIGWIPAGGSLHWVVQESQGYNFSSSGLNAQSPSELPLPAVSTSASWLSDGAKVTVGAQSGTTRYRVLAVPAGQFLTSNGGTTSGTVVIGRGCQQHLQDPRPG